MIGERMLEERTGATEVRFTWLHENSQEYIVRRVGRTTRREYFPRMDWRTPCGRRFAGIVPLQLDPDGVRIDERALFEAAERMIRLSDSAPAQRVEGE